MEFSVQCRLSLAGLATNVEMLVTTPVGGVEIGTVPLHTESFLEVCSSSERLCYNCVYVRAITFP